MGILMLVASLFPLGVLQYLKHRTGLKIAVWKQILCVFLFELSFAPYTTVFFLGRGNMGFVDCFYFFLIWTFFYIARSLLPARISIIAPVVFGLMLIEPVSFFITISDGHLAFSDGSSRAIDLSRGGDKILDFMHALYKIAWAVLPLVGTHYLMKSIARSHPEQWSAHGLRLGRK